METSNKIAWIIDSEHSDISFKINYTSLAENPIPLHGQKRENLQNDLYDESLLSDDDLFNDRMKTSNLAIDSGDFFCKIDYSMMAFTGSHFSKGPGTEIIAGILVISETRKFVMLEFTYEKQIFVNKHRRICYKANGTIHKDDFIPFEMLNFSQQKMVLDYEIHFSGTVMFKKAPGIAH